MEKHCTGCHVLLEIGKNITSRAYQKHRYQCRKCCTERAMEWRSRNKEHYNKYERDWQTKWRKKNPGKKRANVKRYYDKLRREVLEMYGDKCAGCGCTASEVLELNHIQGGGGQERKRLASTTLYRRVIQGLEPREKFNLLCSVCNIAHYCNLAFKQKWKIGWIDRRN